MLFQLAVVIAVLVAPPKHATHSWPETLGASIVASGPPAVALPTVDGWAGADGGYTVRLDASRRLWLFADTWLGKITGQRRPDGRIVSNSIGIERVVKGKSQFHYCWGQDGGAFFRNARPGEWYWPLDGVWVGDKLVIVLNRVKKTDPSSPFGFMNMGQDMAVIAPNKRPPEAWPATIRELGSFRYQVGIAAVTDQRFLYLFMDDQDPKHVIRLARMPAKDAISGEPALEFYAGNHSWSKDPAEAVSLFPGAPEMSVRREPKTRRWIALFTEGGLSSSVLEVSSATLTGPWSKPALIFTCPETAWSPRYYCYGAKQIAPLDEGEPLSFVYNVNSFDFGDLGRDARIYVPRIVVP